MFVSDEVHDRAERFGDRTALRVDGVRVDGASEMSFAAWDRRANAVARGLTAAGVRKGDRVALLMTNHDACALQVAYVAVLRAGAVAVLVNPRYARREIEHVLSDSGARAVVTAGDQTARAHELTSGAPGVAVLPYTDLVDRDDSAFGVDVDVLVALVVIRGVVEGGVDGAEFLDGRVDGFAHLLFVGKVALHRQR